MRLLITAAPTVANLTNPERRGAGADDAAEAHAAMQRMLADRSR